MTILEFKNYQKCNHCYKEYKNETELRIRCGMCGGNLQIVNLSIDILADMIALKVLTRMKGKS